MITENFDNNVEEIEEEFLNDFSPDEFKNSITIDGFPCLCEYLKNPKNEILRKKADSELLNKRCDYSNFFFDEFAQISCICDGILLDKSTPTTCVIEKILGIYNYNGIRRGAFVEHYETLFKNAARIRSLLNIPGENDENRPKVSLAEWAKRPAPLPLVTDVVLNYANNDNFLMSHYDDDFYDKSKPYFPCSFSKRNPTLLENIKNSKSEWLLTGLSAVYLDLIKCLYDFYVVDYESDSATLKNSKDGLFYSYCCIPLLNKSSYYLGFIDAMSDIPARPNKTSKENDSVLMADVAKAHKGCYSGELFKGQAGIKFITDATVILNLQTIWLKKREENPSELTILPNDGNARNYLKYFRRLPTSAQMQLINKHASL